MIWVCSFGFAHAGKQKLKLIWIVEEHRSVNWGLVGAPPVRIRLYLC